MRKCQKIGHLQGVAEVIAVVLKKSDSINPFLQSNAAASNLETSYPQSRPQSINNIFS